MNPQEKLREKAERIVNNYADLLLPENERLNELQGMIEQALIETRNQALEEAASRVEWRGVTQTGEMKQYAHMIRALKTGEGK